MKISFHQKVFRDDLQNFQLDFKDFPKLYTLRKQTYLFSVFPPVEVDSSSSLKTSLAE